jgi:hypothetical protein
MAIKFPFGASLNPDFYGGLNTLTKVAAASTAPERTVDSMVNYLRIATATKGKTLKLFADSLLPAGAVVYISAASASSEILLGSGFSGQSFINAATAAKGTGSWIASFLYNGTDFIAMSKPTRPNVRKSV